MCAQLCLTLCDPTDCSLPVSSLLMSKAELTSFEWDPEWVQRWYQQFAMWATWPGRPWTAEVSVVEKHTRRLYGGLNRRASGSRARTCPLQHEGSTRTDVLLVLLTRDPLGPCHCQWTWIRGMKVPAEAEAPTFRPHSSPGLTSYSIWFLTHLPLPCSSPTVPLLWFRVQPPCCPPPGTQSRCSMALPSLHSALLLWACPHTRGKVQQSLTSLIFLQWASRLTVCLLPWKQARGRGAGVHCCPHPHPRSHNIAWHTVCTQ